MTILYQLFSPQLHASLGQITSPSASLAARADRDIRKKLAKRAVTRLDDSLVSFKHLGDMQHDPIQERYFEWVLERLKALPEISASAPSSLLSG
jgi:hypothetical protein